MPLPWAVVVVVAVGIATGITELVSRYRDAPLKATFSRPGLLYFTVNGLAAASALVLVREFDLVASTGPVPLK